MTFAGTQQELYPVWRLARLGILRISCWCRTIQPHSICGLWVEERQWWFIFSSLSKHHCSPQDPTSGQGPCLMQPSYEPSFLFSIFIAQENSLLRNSPIHCIKKIYFQSQLLASSSVCITHNASMMQSNEHRSDSSDDKWIILLSANNFQQTMCIVIVRDMIYISSFIKKTDCKATLFYPSPAFGGVWCTCECDMLTWVSSLSNQYPWGSESTAEASSRFIWIRVLWQLLEYGQHTSETPYVNYQ